MKMRLKGRRANPFSCGGVMSRTVVTGRCRPGSLTPFAAGLAVVSILSGCASTQSRFDQARAFEAEGRYAESAEQYVEVLEREPDWPEAREALVEVGPHAIESLLAQAEEAVGGRAFERGLAYLDEAGDLHRAAAGLGIALPLPADFDASYAEMLDRTVEALRNEAGLAADAGDWPTAARALERAHDVRPPGSSDRRDLLIERAELYLMWGEALLTEGAPRAGFDVAARAITLVGSGRLADGAADLQVRAVSAGSRRVAFVPVQRTKTVDLDAPEGFVEDLEQILAVERWGAPPAFILPTSPIVLRRELRRRELEDLILATGEAAELGRAVNADYVVTVEIVSFASRERDREDEVKRARLRADRVIERGPRDVNYVESSRVVEYEVEVAYRIVDTRTRRSVRDRTFSRRASTRVRTARYAGDHGDLELSGSTLKLFTGAVEREALEDLAFDLADQVAARLAERVYPDLLGLIR